MEQIKIRDLPTESEKSNGLGRLGGTWTEEEYQSFEASIAMTEQIDEMLWPEPRLTPRPCRPAI